MRCATLLFKLRKEKKNATFLDLMPASIDSVICAIKANAGWHDDKFRAPSVVGKPINFLQNITFAVKNTYEKQEDEDMVMKIDRFVSIFSFEGKII